MLTGSLPSFYRHRPLFSRSRLPYFYVLFQIFVQSLLSESLQQATSTCPFGVRINRVQLRTRTLIMQALFHFGEFFGHTESKHNLYSYYFESCG